MKHLIDQSTIPPSDFTKEFCKNELKSIKKKLFEIQNMFYADGRFSLLVILQGVDTSGKDGVTRHVFSSMNPMGVNVTSFKKPVGNELEHDFLWRIYPHFPAKRMIKVFNRSYYEDILVPSMNKTLDKENIQYRCKLINDLEDHLLRNDTQVIKFILHVSKEEQKDRVNDRKKKPNKKWKYDIADNKTSEQWDSSIEAHNLILQNCNQRKWHVIPSDKRWYRNYEVARILLEDMQALKLKYPG